MAETSVRSRNEAREEARRRVRGFEVADDVVALYVDCAVVDQHWHHAAWVDAEKVGLHVLIGGEIYKVAFPLQAFEVEVRTHLLGA